MVNTDLAKEFYAHMSCNRESFPYVLNALIRQNMLHLIETTADKVALIENEDKEVRKPYLSVHLQDLADEISDTVNFLGFFRDVPLGKSSKNKGVKAEEIRLALKDELGSLLGVCEEVKEEVNFKKAKKQAKLAAEELYSTLAEQDERLSFDWPDDEPESEPEAEPEADCVLE